MHQNFNKEDIVGVECRHVFYIPPPRGDNKADDFHFAKEVIHLKDGRVVPYRRLWKNFKRRYWIAKPAFRKYKQKKEWEDVRKLQEFKTRQCDLKESIARSLGIFGFQGTIRKLQNNPYIYGSDILSTSVVKQEVYRDHFPNLNTPSTVAVCDTETDMVHGHKRVIMTTITMKDRAFTTITKEFLARYPDATKRLHECAAKYLGDVMAARNIKWEIKVVDTDIDSMYFCIQKAHEWMPDFLTFWNVDFDITEMIKAFERERIDPADVFCDPMVPQSHRYFNYIRGAAQKVTASGKVTPVKPAARWHTVDCPASFYIIDSMCVYRQVRTGQAEKPSYALDAILNGELGIRKLKFKEADHLKGAEWHTFMQRHFPLEYTVYNLFDCVSVEILDEKTRDLSTAFPSGVGVTDFRRANSQPRKLCDRLHYFVMKKYGKIIGCTGDEMADEFDKLTVSLTDWIVMLPAHLVADNGLRIIKDAPHMRSSVFLHVGDTINTALSPH